jgi:hypothetical protein
MGNAYRRFEQTLVATVPSALLTVPAATTAIVKSVIVANNNASSSNITITFAPAGSGTHFLVPEEALASKEFTDFLAQAGPLILEAGDVVNITSSQNDVFVTLSALLVDRT